MTDAVSLLLAGATGAAAAVAVSYGVFYYRPRSRSTRTVVRAADGELAKGAVSTTELERSRREMRALVVERDLLSGALMKVYEAESDGRITKDERETIAKKYSGQIKELQAKLKDVELVVEVGELESLREELVTMFQEKIQNLEARLDSAKERLGSLAPQVMVPVPAAPTAKKEAAPRPEKGPDLEKVVERRARPELSESEKRVKEIRNEVLEALTKLERIDVEKKQQET